MNSIQKREFLLFSAKSFLLLVFIIVLVRTVFYLSPQHSFRFAEVLPSVYFILSVVLHYFLIIASAKRPQQFVNYFMAGLSVKIFFSLAFIVVFALTMKSTIVSFLISAVFVYFSITILEVISLLKYLNKNQ